VNEPHHEHVVNVLIASPLEAELVERIQAAEPQRVRVLYEPELLPEPRYPNDHGGAPRTLSERDLARWRELLAQADVSFDFDRHDPGNLLAHMPRVRWIQGTSAGIAGYVQHSAIPPDGPILTTAAGVHAQALAEFALLSMLYFRRGMPELHDRQARHNWERYSGELLAGSTALVLGLGSVGRRTAELASAVGVRVVGTRRGASSESIPGVERLVRNDDLDDVLPGADFIVVCLPGTAETRHLLDERRLQLTKRGAVVVNIGRGTVIDEAAMVAALQSGHLAGAGLDVFEHEPLPPSSPLWDMPNVLITPHSMSTVSGENARIVDLFIDNLHRFLDGRPMRNVYEHERGY
jgi:glyoxylate/hydroxypyruvate reductase